MNLAKTLYPGGIEIRWDANIGEVLCLRRLERPAPFEIGRLEECAEIARALGAYCGLDTEGMIGIAKWPKSMV